MRTYLVEVSPPFFDQNLRLGARTKPFEAQTLVAELAVEALRDAILPRLAGFDQCRADALRDDPRQQCLIPILTLSNPWLPSRGVRWT